MDTSMIMLTQKDHARIKHVLSQHNDDNFEDLELELDRAKIIADNEVPRELVTMNSQVRCWIEQEQRELTLTLVYPKDANSQEGKISILAPLGSALIGLSVGQSINWMFPNGQTKSLKILEVLYQPEANQDWHL